MADKRKVKESSENMSRKTLLKIRKKYKKSWKSDNDI